MFLSSDSSLRSCSRLQDLNGYSPGLQVRGRGSTTRNLSVPLPVLPASCSICCHTCSGEKPTSTTNRDMSGGGLNNSLISLESRLKSGAHMNLYLSSSYSSVSLRILLLETRLRSLPRTLVTRAFFKESPFPRTTTDFLPVETFSGNCAPSFPSSSHQRLVLLHDRNTYCETWSSDAALQTSCVCLQDALLLYEPAVCRHEGAFQPRPYKCTTCLTWLSIHLCGDNRAERRWQVRLSLPTPEV